jgi:hypothetical protein
MLILAVISQLARLVIKRKKLRLKRTNLPVKRVNLRKARQLRGVIRKSDLNEILWGQIIYVVIALASFVIPKPIQQ